MDKDAGALDHHISELEQLVNRLGPSCHFSVRRAFLKKVIFFKSRKPTSTHHGVNFADRVMIVHFRVRKLFDDMSLEPLAGFAERQSSLMMEITNMRFDESNLIQEAKLVQAPDEAEEITANQAAKLQDEEGNGNNAEEEDGEILPDIHRPITPISPVPSSPIPFSVAIRSLNTSTRHHITKELSQSFNLNFNPGTRHYDLIDSAHHPSYFLHTFHPLNLKIVAWAPGSLQAHTQTKDYVKKKGTGDYMNFTMENVEGLEMLVAGLKEDGVEVLKMEL
ncbi:MAG: hypothetical protein Q9168_005434 [Polycauliona sp. 1 TL-2023]